MKTLFQRVATGLLFFLIPFAAQAASAKCAIIEDNSSFTDLGPTVVNVAIGGKNSGGANTIQPLPSALTGGTWTVSDRDIATIVMATGNEGTISSDRRIVFLDENSVEVSFWKTGEFSVPKAGISCHRIDLNAEAGNDLQQSTSIQSSKVASVGECYAAEPRAIGQSNEADKVLSAVWPTDTETKYGRLVLFNTAGQICRQPTLLRHGDFLVFGLVIHSTDQATRPESWSATATNCAIETPNPTVYSSGNIPSAFAKQKSGGQFEIVRIGQATCASDAPVVTVTSGTGDGKLKRSHTLTQYKRYRASFHLGVLNSKLRDPQFSVTSVGGQNVVVNTADPARSPEYVGAIIVHGLPHYLQGMLRGSGNDPINSGYKGRDLLHDNGWKDRLGLVISAGLKNPGDRFGLGLAYELATGINIIGVHEWHKSTRLVGLTVGDAFAGEAAAIPTTRITRKDWSLGITFDIGYITNLFAN